MSETTKKVLQCACELRKEYEEISPVGAVAVCATFEAEKEKTRALAEIDELEKKLKRLRNG